MTPEDGDKALVEMFLKAMVDTGADMTNSFRALAEGAPMPVDPRDEAAFDSFFAAHGQRLMREGQTLAEARARMLAANPAIIPRNHLVEQALGRAEEGEHEPFRELVAAVTRPFAPRAEDARFRMPPRPEERVQATFCGT
jgi:uncharacterized protein YdiU (UPF0061 family)